MKKIFFVISIAFFCITTMLAENKIDETTFTNLVDYVSCRYVNSYIRNYPDKKDKDKNAYVSSIKPVLDSCTLDKHLSREKLETLLQNNSWGETASMFKSWYDTKKFSDVSEKNDSNIIDYIVKVDKDLSKVITSETVKVITSETVKVITSELLERYKYAKPKQKKSAEHPKNKYDDLNEKIVALEKHQTELIFYVVVLTLIVIGFFFYFRNKTDKIKSDIKYIFSAKALNRNVELGEYIIQQVLFSQQINDKFKPQILNTIPKTNANTSSFDDKTIDAIVDRVLERMKLNEPEKQKSKTTETVLNVETSKPTPIVAKYLKEREGMMLFKEATEDSAYYEIFNINGNKASYRFCGDFARSMANYDAVLKDVFDDEKSYQSKAKNITNEKEGDVELQPDGKWEIKTQAKIKFI